jgi:hypothetical protein
MKCRPNGAPENYDGKDAGPQNFKGIKGMMGAVRHFGLHHDGAG